MIKCKDQKLAEGKNYISVNLTIVTPYIPNVGAEIAKNKFYKIVKYGDSGYWNNVNGGLSGYLERRKERLKILQETINK